MYYKLISLMSKNKITFKTLLNSLIKLRNFKIHVIGDMIIDTYTKTSLIGGYLKTPTPSVLYQEKNNYIGGAGIIAKHLSSAGAKVTLTTVLGNDELKNFVFKFLSPFFYPFHNPFSSLRIVNKSSFTST